MYGVRVEAGRRMRWAEISSILWVQGVRGWISVLTKVEGSGKHHRLSAETLGIPFMNTGKVEKDQPWSDYIPVHLPEN